MRSTRVIGLLSGTSMDAIDIAVAEFRLPLPGAIDLHPLGHTESPLPSSLRTRLIDALPPGSCTTEELCKLDTELGQAFAEAAEHGLRTLAGGRADLVASLGQTIYHWVEAGHTRGTLQIGQPAWIAEATGLPVIADIRARDVASGGHGAPLAIVLDALWLASSRWTRIALNIGGIANITVVGPGQPLAYDTGPGNALIDAAVRRISGGDAAQDTDGAIADRGTVHPGLLAALQEDPYYQRKPPKSTGKERFNDGYLQRAISGIGGLSDADLLATLTELTAATITAACQQHQPQAVVASGGGVRNTTLMTALCRRLTTHGIELVTSDDLGLPASAKEAYLSALLGFLTWHGLPCPTGAQTPRLLGSITPGSGPLRLAEPAGTGVERLHVVPPGTPLAPTPQEARCEPWTS